MSDKILKKKSDFCVIFIHVCLTSLQLMSNELAFGLCFRSKSGFWQTYIWFVSISGHKFMSSFCQITCTHICKYQQFSNFIPVSVSPICVHVILLKSLLCLYLTNSIFLIISRFSCPSNAVQKYLSQFYPQMLQRFLNLILICVTWCGLRPAQIKFV